MPWWLLTTVVWSVNQRWIHKAAFSFWKMTNLLTFINSLHKKVSTALQDLKYILCVCFCVFCCLPLPALRPSSRVSSSLLPSRCPSSRSASICFSAGLKLMLSSEVFCSSSPWAATFLVSGCPCPPHGPSSPFSPCLIVCPSFLNSIHVCLCKPLGSKCSFLFYYIY